ncbi:MAG: DEAD/DEAH box helicase [Oscillospiraceae bacterium]|nr:DEAD/DEAH box helicase [Oscillospiraceae bacterium]
MGLSDDVIRAVEDMGFEEATHIQSQSIPLILAGRDVIGHSQTGTGKTAAFSIPALEKIDPTQHKTVQVLILCPTRELAVQACDEIRKFAKYKQGIKAVPIFGGQQIDRQITALRQGAQIVVGTPGRIMDHMRRRTLKLDGIRMVILDEADEMLSMGFREDIETILADVPDERQTILFSATMSREIIRITREYQKEPELIKVAHEQVTVPSIEQLYYEVPQGKKVEVLSRLLDVYNPSRSMVFCNTKSMVDDLVSELQLRGYPSGGLHGDMKQAARTQMMNSFKKGQIDVLVATDVAARGIDVENIEAVFNYDIPQDVEYYVHRIGRTGRAGKEGRAFSFVSGRRQINELRDIEAFTKSKIELHAVPSSDEVLETRFRQVQASIVAAIQSGALEQYNTLVDALLEEHSSLELVSALIQLLVKKDDKDSLPNRNDDAVFAAEYGKNRHEIAGKHAPRTGRGVKRQGDFSVRPRRDNADFENIRLSVGRKEHVSASHILGAVAGYSGLPGSSFGRIEIFQDYTLVGVPKGSADAIVASLKDCKIMRRRAYARREG